MVEADQCSACRRAPLVGESVTVVAVARREAVVCDACARKPRAGSLGEPVRRERVRSPEGAATVQRVYPRPVAPARVAPAAGRPA